METCDQQRRQLIENLMAPHTNNIADAAIILLEQLSIQVISIVGEGGFNSLYARSVFLTRSTFPGLVVNATKPMIDNRFADLKKILEAQTAAQASEATILLLITFTDILASLIGEQLTTIILRSAWGDDPSYKPCKEFKL